MRTVQLSSLEKILKYTDLDGIEEFDSYSILKNERFAYQIVIKNDSEYDEKVKIEIDSPLKNAVSVNLIGYVYVNVPSEENIDGVDGYVIYSQGYVPDALLPVENGEILLPKGENTSVLITVNGDKFDIDAGEYDITVNLHTDNENVSKAFSLDVINAKLPEQQLMYTDWFHCDAIALIHNVEVFSEKFWVLVEKYMLEAAHAGMNMILTPIFTPPLDTPVGEERLTVQLVDIEMTDGIYSFDFSKLYRWIELAKKCGIKYFEMAHLFTQWGAKCTPKIVVKIDGKDEKMFGWHVEATDKLYADFLSQFLPSLVDALNNAGVADVTFFHISDEPTNNDTIEQYRNCRTLVEKYIKGFVIMDALSEPEYYEQEAVTYPVPVTLAFERFLKFDIKDRWTYYCCGPSVNYSNRLVAMCGWMTRMIGCQLYKFDVKGFLHWGFNCFFSRLTRQITDPYTKNDYYNFPTGDNNIVYPLGDSVTGSLREQLFFDALQDQRALELLGSCIGKDKTVKLIEDIAQMKIEFGKFPHNAQFILDWRRKVNDAIKDLLTEE